MRTLGLTLLALLLVMASDATAQGRVRAVVTSDVANIRIIPALGADVRGNVPGGFLIDPITARSPDNEWYRFNFAGDEGWINFSTLAILEGDVNALPVADPRSIPYGGFEAPRAGQTSAADGPTARVIDWLRVRSGPSVGYVVIANAPINSSVVMLGRTASSNWIQINFEGTLGWVSRQWLEFPSGFILSQLPIDGIVAEAPPAGDAPEDFLNTLRLMRSRLDLAQPSLDAIRASWTDAALTGRASCQPYPAQPSNFNIPNPLLAAYFNQLDPLIRQFNDAMFNVRYAIDLFIEVCEQAGTVNPVGQATVMGALDVLSLADRQFIDLRRQLDELIPPEAELGAGECLLSFGGAVEILPVITIGQLVLESFSSDRFVVGYCFDATQGQSLTVDVLQKAGGNANYLLSVSPFDNPSNFLAVGRGTTGTDLLRLGPINIPQTGRYLVILSSEFPPEGALQSEFGLLIYETDGMQGGLIIDPVTGEITIVTRIPALQPTQVPGAPSLCPNVTFTCQQLATCEQAEACLALGNASLDPDNDGIPCEGTLCTPFP